MDILFRGFLTGIAIIVAVIFGVPLLLVGCLFLKAVTPSQSETFRYKLTINVRVNGAPYSASSIIEARQVQGNCLAPGWGGSGSSARTCPPRFLPKGVAPMIKLPGGSTIFASLNGHHGSSVEERGVGLGYLPWAIYSNKFKRDEKDQLVHLPVDTPTLEIPFSLSAQSRPKPSMWMSIAGQVDLPRAVVLVPGRVHTLSHFNVVLVSYKIENSDEPLIETINPAPAWLLKHREELKKLYPNRTDLPSRFESLPLVPGD